MNGALAQAAAVDPDWAKREQRRARLLKAITAGVLVALTVGTIAFVISFHDSERITQVEHSACQVDPAGRECQLTKQESSKAASVYTTCIAFKKVGYVCPKPGTRAARRQMHAAAKSFGATEQRSGQGGVTPQTPSSAPQQPGPHHGGSAHGVSGEPTAPNPTPSTPTAPTTSPTSSTPTPPQTPSSPPAQTPAEPETAPPAAPDHPIRETVEHVGETVKGVVCTATSLLHPC